MGRSTGLMRARAMRRGFTSLPAFPAHLFVPFCRTLLTTCLLLAAAGTAEARTVLAGVEVQASSARIINSSFTREGDACPDLDQSVWSAPPRSPASSSQTRTRNSTRRLWL